VLGAALLVAVLLSLAASALYAILSLIVSQRTREIGIRVALGANPRRIVLTTFSRNFAKVVIGLVVGTIPAAVVSFSLGPEVAPIAGYQLSILVCAMATLTVAAATILACVAPARRALQIQPITALKAE